MGTKISRHQLQQAAKFNEIPKMRESFRRRLSRSLSTSLIHLANTSEIQASLFTAVEKGDVDFAKVLLRSKGVRAKINEKNKDQQTVLYIAVVKGNLKLVELLLKHGANPNILCKVEMEIEDMINHVLAYSFLYGISIMDNVPYSLMSTNRTPLMEAAWLGLNNILKKLLRSKVAHTKVKDDYGNTAVHFATVQNQFLCLDLLLRNGANPDVANKCEALPVQYAACIGNIDILNLLIAHGCELSRDSANKYYSALFPRGTDALFNAVHFGNLNCAMLLLDNGADVHKMMKNLSEFWVDYKFFRVEDETIALPHTLKDNYNEDTKDLLITLLRANGKLEEPPNSFIQEHILHPAVRNHDYELVQLLCSLGLQATEQDYRCAAANDQEIYDWWKAFYKQPRSLKDLSRLKIRSTLKHNVVHNMEQLTLPTIMKNYITINSPSHYSHLVAAQEEE